MEELRNIEAEVREADQEQSQKQEMHTREIIEEIGHVLGQSRFDFDEWLKTSIPSGQAVMSGIDPRTF